MKYLIYDIGGSYIKYSLITGNREILLKEKKRTPLESKTAFVEAIKEIYHLFDGQVNGIAVSMPGKIDVFNGYASSAGVLTFLNETNMVSLFRTFTKLPVAVENDGKCAALAESWAGALKGIQHGVVLVFGTGVGGGIILNSTLHRGSSGIAGEFSFIKQDDANFAYPYFGHIGSVLSLIRLIEIEMDMASGSLTGEIIFDQIESGNQEMRVLLHQFCKGIAQQIVNLQYIFDPEVFAIGGGISERDIFIEIVRLEVKRLINSNPFHMVHPVIVPCKYRNDANMIGALMNFYLNKIHTD
ncbi:hypothetical protein A5886_000709 [Enterococcus sp. 8G7_MSG3316]|uniref:ROK family protein n=1 Tax=Candidatus Enterococcus testudinis TaxID=1834191 RepID=A0A242A3N4_9ENTE|nr:ROK family protein [Enterococcus sp. 8G7_MSG3316]OTN75634.1 hypothetical protein A5886_000709 [Enterococcus sp. 8G7_MSG3316]